MTKEKRHVSAEGLMPEIIKKIQTQESEKKTRQKTKRERNDESY
jgi:hypothetical protein